jgi:hypothetical protein
MKFIFGSQVILFLLCFWDLWWNLFIYLFIYFLKNWNCIFISLYLFSHTHIYLYEDFISKRSASFPHLEIYLG